MKGWAIAVVLSVTVHAALFASMSPSPPTGERVGVRGDPFIAFTPVEVVIEPKREARGAPRKATAARVAAAEPPLEVAGPAVASTAEPVTPLPSGGEGEAEGDVVAPHPDPLPAAQGEGDRIVGLVHARLAAAAERCYPPAARRYQQRGTVQLSFCTDAQGATVSSEVTQSSGAELLDAAARGCVVENAAPFPLEAASRCFSVPVRFGERR